jgi:hypothetical protein
LLRVRDDTSNQSPRLSRQVVGTDTNLHDALSAPDDERATMRCWKKLYEEASALRGNLPFAEAVAQLSAPICQPLQIARRFRLPAALFRDLVDGAMSLEAFRTTQEQFFFAVSFFPRPMAALVGRLPHPRQRLEILHNLVEEHGEFDESRFHHNTFQQFLRTIGSGPQALEGLRIWPAVHAFNSVLTAACVLDELEIGVACMGIIEYAFADISALIGRAVTERGWVGADKLVHYKRRK